MYKNKTISFKNSLIIFMINLNNIMLEFKIYFYYAIIQMGIIFRDGKKIHFNFQNNKRQIMTKYYIIYINCIEIDKKYVFLILKFWYIFVLHTSL